MKKKLLLLFVTVLFSLNHYSQNLSIIEDKDCDTGCSNLSMIFNNASGVSQFNVASIPYNPPASFNGLVSNLVGADDRWSDVINLPFDFSFFGNSYSSFLISGNGAITFELENANSSHDWRFTEELPNSTNNAFSHANIFTAMHDLDPAQNGVSEIGWEVIGESPNRAMVISYFNMPQYDCSDLSTTQMVVLYETTNIIEMYIEEKPLCSTWNDGNAVLGIQNIEGTEAIVPPGRNTGAWEANSEAWRFVPVGSEFQNEYVWYDPAGAEISNEMSINVCPTTEEIYTAEVTYYDVSTESYETVTESITLNANTEDPSFFMTPTCDGATATITGDLGGVFNFNPIATDGATLDAVTGTVTNATSGTTYTLEYTTSGNCPTSSSQSFTVLVTEDASFILTSDCSGGATATITGNTGGTFTFNPVISDGSSIDPTTGEITNGVSGTMYSVEYSISGTCTASFMQDVIIFDSSLEIVTPENMEVCSPFELDVDIDLTTQTNVITGGSTCGTVSYYESLVDAENATNVITNPSYYNSYTSNPFTIYVRVEDNNTGSFQTTMFDVVVNLSPEISASELINCAESDGVATFYLPDMNLGVTNGNSDYNVSYYGSFEDAENEVNVLPDLFVNETINFQVIYARVNDLTNACYSISECYLNVDNGLDLSSIGDLVQCGDSGVASFDLVSYVYQQVNGSTLAELTFYHTQEDAVNETNAIFPADAYTNLNNPDIIFVRAQDINSGCLSFGSFMLNIEDVPIINVPTPLTTCDFDGGDDGLYVFQLNQKDAEILEGLDANAHSVTYYATQEEAETGTNALDASGYYNTIPNIQTVYVRVENVNYGCATFTTLDLVIDAECQLACQENVTFCYDNSDTTEYTYSNDNGVPLTVIFNAGQVENSWDELIVLDSDGTELYNGYGNGGDLTGLTFTSTGGSITVLVQSDASISCSSGNYTAIEFVVFCYVETGSIEVNAFLDENSDTIFDASEVNFSSGEFTYEVNNDGVTNYVNSSSGSFVIPNAQEGDTYDIGFTMFDVFSSCLAQTFTLVQDVESVEGEIAQVNFPLTSIADCNDIAVYLTSNVPPRPGVLYNNILTVENLGSGTVSGTVEFTHDASVALDNVSNLTSGNTITNTATGFILNFNNLSPGSTEQVNIQLNIPTNLNIGDLVTNSVVYNVSDIDIDNNESILTQEVVNSYDPNNKLEAHGPEIKLDEFTNEDFLYYTINFQNLGTAEALDIRVEDVLDAQLDASTFKMLNASHDYMVTRVANNLTWLFEDINLPSESMDEPNSHGYVYFKIKPLAGYQEGDIIPNVADIYFDFNPAITTNTFETKFVTSLSVNEFSTIGYNMYPNPANGIVHVQFNTAIAEKIKVSIYNVQGKLVNTPSTISNTSKISFNVANLSQGLYFVELQGESFKTVEKLMVE